MLQADNVFVNLHLLVSEAATGHDTNNWMSIIQTFTFILLLLMAE